MNWPAVNCLLVALTLFLLGDAAAAQAPTAPSYRVVSRIAGPDGGWDLAGVDAASGRLYVARSDGVMAIDLATGKVTPNLVPSAHGHAALPIPGSTRVISTSGGANTATIFEGITGQIVANLAVGKNPDAVAYDPATRTLWVMNPGSGDISVVEPATAEVVATVAVGGSLELGAADGEGRLYVNVEDRNDVAVIDTRTRQLVTRFPLTGCDRPSGIAYAPDVRLIVSPAPTASPRCPRRTGTKWRALPSGLDRTGRSTMRNGVWLL